MKWLNIHLDDLLDEVFIGADPVQRSTWLSLTAYCARRENGGAIENCREWKDRKWQQVAGVTKDEVFTESELWWWENDDIVVWNYPEQQEYAVKRKRMAGKMYGRKKKKPERKPVKPPKSEDGGVDVDEEMVDADPSIDPNQAYKPRFIIRGDKEIAAMIADIKSCREEFDRINDHDLYTKLTGSPEEGRGERVRDFCIDMANAMELPPRPTQTLKNFLEYGTDKFDKTAPKTNFA